MTTRRQKKKHGKKRKKRKQQQPDPLVPPEWVQLSKECYHGKPCAFLKSRLVDGLPEMLCKYNQERVIDIYREQGTCPADKWWMYRENDCVECVGVPVEVERKRKPRLK